MNQQLQQDNYFVVEEFLHDSAAAYISKEFKRYCVETMARPDTQVAGSPAVYGYPLIDQLLISKIFYMNDLVGERLYPTYCYSRWYKNGAELKPHTDAEPCEVSVTINLAGQEWPIYFTKPNGSTASAILKPGDAVIYKGTKSMHWREKFTGTECIQAFLHYVKIDGPNYLHAFDLQRHMKRSQ